MTEIEQRAMEIVTAYLPRIAKELEAIAQELRRANRLKSVELHERKARCLTTADYHESIDKIMEG